MFLLSFSSRFGAKEPNTMNHDKVISIAKEISLDELSQLITIFASHIVIFVPKGTADECDTLAEVYEENPVCLNGASIQINLER